MTYSVHYFSGSMGSEVLDTTTHPEPLEHESKCIKLDFNAGMRMGLRLQPAVSPFLGYMEVCRWLDAFVQFCA